MKRVPIFGMALLSLYLTFLVIGLGWVHEYRSCVRSNGLIPAVRQYPLDAAVARESSARHELAPGPRHDPVQAHIDLIAAMQFRVDAGHQQTLDCAQILPPTH